VTELKRDELRSKLEKIVRYAERCGFDVSVDDINVDVGIYYELGDVVPHLEGLKWIITLELEADVEEVNPCQSKCSVCKSQSR